MWLNIIALLYLQKLNSPAVLKAPKERKPSKKEGGSPGKSSNLPAMLYRLACSQYRVLADHL